MGRVRETLCDVYIISQESHYGQPYNAGKTWEAVCSGRGKRVRRRAIITPSK